MSASDAGPPPHEVHTVGSLEPAVAAGVRRRRSALWRIVDGLLLCGVAGMLATVTLQVLSRFSMSSLPWTEELTRYLFIWTAFLGLAAGFRTTEHARITLLVSSLPRSLRIVAVYLYAAAGFLFFGTVTYTGWNLVVQQFRSGEMSPVLDVGMYVVTLPVVIGAVLALWAHIESIWLDATTRNRLERGEMVE
ncbi:TRAP transporter small permease [Salinarimonas rosea]|uniref:TRAP transporter small permease n=1 Tax=Salinarimonas rosea TaxID=552063 RepID=UPI00146FA969|nr:TRAP transporter small permease [Salinarimonas rosea]